MPSTITKYRTITSRSMVLRERSFSEGRTAATRLGTKRTYHPPYLSRVGPMLRRCADTECLLCIDAAETQVVEQRARDDGVLAIGELDHQQRRQRGIAQVSGHLGVIDIAILQRFQPKLVTRVAQMKLSDSRSRLAKQSHRVLIALMHPIEIHTQGDILRIGIAKDVTPFARILEHFRRMVMNAELESASR